MRVSWHVAVFVFPFGSHATPLLNLVKRITASAPENVKFSILGTAESNRPIYSGAKDDDEFTNIKAYNVSDGVPKDHVFTGNALLEQIGMFINATPGNFEKAMKEAEEDTGVKISCLLTDAFLWFAADLAQKIGVPWIPFWPAASCSLSAHLYTDDIRRLVAANGKRVEMIPGFEGLSINDMPREVLLDNEQSPLALLLHNMALNLPRATAVVVNSFEEIDPALTLDLKSKLQKVLKIIPTPSMAAASKKTSSFRVYDNDECLEWLKKQDDASVVYIGFGSVCIPPPDEMVGLAEALETCKTPFLWSLKDHARKSLPAGFVDRTSGYGKPFFGDHGLNSAMVELKWRIGMRVKDGVFTKNGTINAIKLILDGEKEGKEIKENVKLLKGLATDAVKLPNGSSARNFQELLEPTTIVDLSRFDAYVPQFKGNSSRCTRGEECKWLRQKLLQTEDLEE
ncbi:OLC1v1035238C1 [Oldenlandia corymbosa var. corymbosa]|uniref:OLC1v1035238C1 n=1 Tax=Oldenlandia corymbosa var. corymbosa TaxID=529605 RepID=A0AAV1CVS1_OLDCO|nr:OLC1v1035238C1 [Oldenlandia corymbosa var. corymbosa]